MTETPRTPPVTPGRRTVRFDTPAAVLADVDRLRRGGYRKVGQWTLPQVCHHLATTVAGNLVPPPSDEEPTPEQQAMKVKFFGLIRNGAPEGMPLAADKVPPAACSDADIDALAAAFATFAQYPHAKLMVGRCGPVPVAEVLELHLHHAAHHLSFLEPTTVRRNVRYGSLDDVTADVQQLRQGWIRSGDWTLPQACWHLRSVTESLLARTVTEATPEMLAKRPMLDAVLAGHSFPVGLPCPPELVPPADASEVEIDRFLALVERMRTQLPSTAMHRLFGPVSGTELASLFLAHCGNHLSYLVPDPGGH